MTRLEVTKTYKLFINGQFPRTESGRSIAIPDGSGGVFAHICHASRKDLRDAVVAARAAQDSWQRRAAYNRGQIFYRLAEMLEGKKREFVESLSLAPGGGDAETSRQRGRGRNRPRASKRRSSPQPQAPNLKPLDEVVAAIDRLVVFAGWADKFPQILGSNNPVQGPYYNYTAPEPTGVVAVVAPDELPLLAFLSLIAPPLCAGNAIVAVASEMNPIPACVLGEVIATSDVPPGVVNILTGKRAELILHIAGHREIDAIHAANIPADDARALREGAAENVKRVTVRSLAPADWLDADVAASPWWIERFVEMKTIWHPAGA